MTEREPRCAWTTARFRTGSGSHKACDKDVCCPHCCFNIFFAAVLEVTVIRFSEDGVILQNLAYLAEETGAGAGTRLDQARRAVGGSCMPMAPALYRGLPMDWRE